MFIKSLIKKGVVFFFFIIIFHSTLISQPYKTDSKAAFYLDKKGEVYFTFTLENRSLLDQLTRIISIDKVKDNFVYAYANKDGFNSFLSYSIDYEILKHPGEKDIETIKTRKSKNIWDFDTHPIYTEFLVMMEHFDSAYSDICEVVNVGNSVLDRDILFVKISDNVNENEQEPRFMYTATMHGDETVGYILMLRLINYLLTNYEVDTEITELIDNTEIWICPLENPDGVYGDGDEIIFPTRSNANNADLNRNYPNPVMGDHPDNKSWQPETQAMMNLFDSLHFVLSANIHAGAELVNYPWDSWTSNQKKHADHNWFHSISRDYASVAQANSPFLYLIEEDNGVTHGGDWYIVYGSRQDYMIYYKQGREITLELCIDKFATMNEADLPLYWDYNYPSLINYIKEANYGIQGTIKDSVTNEPIAAKVTVLNHDKNNSHVYSELPYGDYYRPIEAGTYSLQIEAEGYQTKTVSNVIVQDTLVTTQEIVLAPEIASSIFNKKIINILISPNPSNGFYYIKSQDETIKDYSIINIKGDIIVKKEVNSNKFEIDLTNYKNGFYFLRLTTPKNIIFKKLILL